MWVDSRGRLPTHTLVRHILMWEPTSQSDGNQVRYPSTWFQGNNYKDALKKQKESFCLGLSFPSHKSQRNQWNISHLGEKGNSLHKARADTVWTPSETVLNPASWQVLPGQWPWPPGLRLPWQSSALPTVLSSVWGNRTQRKTLAIWMAEEFKLSPNQC